MSNDLVSTTGAFQFSWDEGICVVTWDEPGKSVNAFSVPIIQDLEAIVDRVLARPDLKGLVIASGKEKCFAAGVDVSIFESLTTFEESEKGALQMQAIFNKLEWANVPTVAAINGVCLGGAFELALACQYRLVSSDPSTKLGAPETKLGIIPGAGGTQRLPRMIGIIPALDLILSGRQLDGKKSLKAGIANACVPRGQLIVLAKQLATSVSLRRSMELKAPRRLMLEKSPLGKAFIRKSTVKTLMKTTKGKYPALFKALDAVLDGISMSLDDGLKNEARLFAECVTTSQSRALVHLFRVMTAAKKDPAPEAAQQKAKELWLNALENGDEAVGILGAGLMGSGVATVLAAEGYRSVMIDNAPAGLERGMARIKEHFNTLVKRRRRTARERDLAVMRVSPSLQSQTLKGSPFIVEAVFEDLKVKGEMLKRCEAIHGERLVFASNTSSLPIGDIAKLARDPGGVVGMHFFSPVPKMPLVEIIQTSQTRPEVLSATFRLAQAMGKTNIVVNDGPGFYTTRVLGFLLAEAMNLLVEGNTIESIDNAMEGFGWPVGPMNLMDEIGIDVGAHVLDTLTAAFGERLKAPEGISEFVKQNRLGRKVEKGFYTYKNGKRVGADTDVYRLMGVVPHTEGMSAQSIAERCTYVFVIEAARCLKQGILRSADDGDLGAIFGLGFPPFLGGPFEFVRQMGREKFIEGARALAEKHGPRYDPQVLAEIQF